LKKRITANNRIRAREVRVIDQDGKQLGVLELKNALQLSLERGLDLVQVTEKVDPPVCKIMNLGKYMYQQEKKEKEQG
jgi:translation initiation factor IF-3